ncbi:MAG: NAD(P)/FAD-dependent oxidoreductase [bacterium]
MDIYDIAVVGGGAAGMMAAIRAGELKKNVVLIERTNALGKKILITGKGRCNVTNSADIDTFVKVFGKQGRFLRSAFWAFSNRALIDFLQKSGLELKAERQGRVFPVTDESSSVVEVLKRSLLKNNVEILYSMRLFYIKKKSDCFQLNIDKNDKIYAKKVILAAGGASYKITGSSGDGYNIAKRLKHTVIPLKAALVPLKTRESWVKQLQGLSLKNVCIFFKCANKKITSPVGEMIFTHFGVSGPLVLDLSAKIVSAVSEYGDIALFVDLKPGLTPEQLENRLLREFKLKQNAQVNNVMGSLLPLSLIPVFLDVAEVPEEKKINQIVRKERHKIANLLKAFPLTVCGSLPIEEAMVTNGGVCTNEINPKTMESKIVPGLYFAGELIDGAAPSGGYNLQQAFSTGYLAGESAAHA